MFVDYSGLQRFSSINRSFANNYLHLLYYDGLPSIQEKLEELQKTDNTVAYIQQIQCDDVKEHIQAIDLLFKLSISVKQMVNEFEVIKRCPTLYVIELFDGRDFNVHDLSMKNCSVELKRSLKDLYSNYEMVISALFKEIKKLILDLRPSDDFESFEGWHVLQKCLFYEHSTNISKFAVPKIDIVIIPVAFPKCYTMQVNNDGFINGRTKLRFLKFDLNLKVNSLYDINDETLLLKPIKNKISTIWKDGDEKDFIGTMWEPETANHNTPRKPPSGISREPGFLSLFKEVFSDTQEAKTPTKHRGEGATLACNEQSAAKISNYKEFAQASPIDSASYSAKASNNLYDVFSPLSSNNLLTALTPANDPGSIGGSKKMGQPNATPSSSANPNVTMVLPPPPPSLLSPYEEFETFSQNIYHHSFKDKFKKLLFRPAQRYFSYHEQKGNGFDTVGSFAEFQSTTWDDMSSKKFLKFKYKKFKRNCRYYKGIAKQCFEDFQDSSLPQH